MPFLGANQQIIRIPFFFTEEILHSAHALWMSKDSRLLMYASFNDTLVKEMRSSWYGDENERLYPGVRILRYPKVCAKKKFLL